MSERLTAGLTALALVALLIGAWLLDPVNRLDLKLSTHPMWVNGFWGFTRLPLSATPKDVVDAYAKMERKPPYRVVEVRTLHTGTNSFAVLCETSHGSKIVVMKYSNLPFGWECREYDADDF